jgi:predicted RNA-binding protein YlqC (UPF0109 family)
MTHIVHPYAHRLGIIRDWKSRWFAGDKKHFRENVTVDAALRTFLTKRLRGTYTATIEIERTANELHLIVHTARPGLVIGRSGENAAKLRKELTIVRHTAAPGDTRTIKFLRCDNRKRMPPLWPTWSLKVLRNVCLFAVY